MFRDSRTLVASGWEPALGACCGCGHYPFQLFGVDFQAGFGPNDIIGLGKFLVDGQLGADALLDLLRGPAAGQETPALSFFRASDTNGEVHFRFSASLEQERNYDRRQSTAFALPGFNLGAPQLPDAGVQNAFQLLAAASVGKDEPGQLTPAQPSV